MIYLLLCTVDYLRIVLLCQHDVNVTESSLIVYNAFFTARACESLSRSSAC